MVSLLESFQCFKYLANPKDKWVEIVKSFVLNIDIIKQFLRSWSTI